MTQVKISFRQDFFKKDIIIFVPINYAIARLTGLP
jgi:hypothetical protein